MGAYGEVRNRGYFSLLSTWKASRGELLLQELCLPGEATGGQQWVQQKGLGGGFGLQGIKGTANYMCSVTENLWESRMEKGRRP